MGIRATCPACSTILDADFECSGTTVFCPTCQQSVSIPTLESVQKAAASDRPQTEAEEETPRRYVTLGATCILVGGTVSLLTWLAVMFALPEPAGANESLEFVRFMLVVQKVLGLPISLLIIYGGMQLQQLKSVEWGLVAAGLCLLPIHACCLVSFIPGVIGLSVLSNPRVTQLIRKERAKHRQRRK